MTGLYPSTLWNWKEYVLVFSIFWVRPAAVTIFFTGLRRSKNQTVICTLTFLLRQPDAFSREILNLTVILISVNSEKSPHNLGSGLMWSDVIYSSLSPSEMKDGSRSGAQTLKHTHTHLSEPTRSCFTAESLCFTENIRGHWDFCSHFTINALTNSQYAAHLYCIHSSLLLIKIQLFIVSSWCISTDTAFDFNNVFYLN